MAKDAEDPLYRTGETADELASAAICVGARIRVAAQPFSDKGSDLIIGRAITGIKSRRKGFLKRTLDCAFLQY
ncbi:MAG: hypothetical protein OXI01_02875 [Albidovulum sp.]|nr:hypothetical protein [Albidovulum sp.]